MTLKEKAVLPIGTVLWQDEPSAGGKAGNDVKLRSVSWLVDNALEEIEKSNAKLKGILNRIGQYQLENNKLLGLINTFSDTSFTKPVYDGKTLNLHSKDVLGHVYEYFLGQFALAEGKQGGQYYTPKSIVTLIVEMLEPYSGRVYDPAMGSGGFFVSSDKFIEQRASVQHYDAAEQKQHVSVYGQESNPTTWKLAAMNMAIRGIDFNFGKKNADSFLDDQHPDLRADFVMANPPFNTKDWWSESLADDARWKYGTPPKGNANFAWLQHMLHHLAPTGSLALLLVLGFWQLGAGALGWIDPFYLPPPSSIGATLLKLFADGSIYTHLEATFGAAFAGLALGLVSGIVLGFVAALVPVLAELLEPVMVLFNAIPRVILAPLFIIWLGIGLPSKVALSFILVVVIIFFSVYNGIREVDQTLVERVRTLGGGTFTLIREVYVPSVVSWVMSNLKVALGFAFTGAVVGEFVASTRGLGYLLSFAQSTYNAALSMALIVMVATVVMLLFAGAGWLERRLLRWKYA